MDYEDDLIIEPFEAFLKSTGTAADRVKDGSWKRNEIYNQSKKNAQKAKGNQELKPQPAQAPAAASAPTPATPPTATPPAAAVSTPRSTGTAADRVKDEQEYAPNAPETPAQQPEPTKNMPRTSNATSPGIKAIGGVEHILDGVANATAAAGKAFKNGLLNANASGLNTVNAVKTAGMETVQALGDVPEKMVRETQKISRYEESAIYKNRINDIISASKSMEEVEKGLMSEYDEISRTRGKAAAKRFGDAVVAAMKSKKQDADNELAQARMDRSRVNLETRRTQNDRKLDMTQRKYEAANMANEEFALTQKNLEEHLKNAPDEIRDQYDLLTKLMDNDGRNENGVPIIMSLFQDGEGLKTDGTTSSDFVNNGFGGLADDPQVLNYVENLLKKASPEGLTPRERDALEAIRKDISAKKQAIKTTDTSYNVEGKKEAMERYAEKHAESIVDGLNPNLIPDIYRDQAGNVDREGLSIDVSTRLKGLILANPTATPQELFKKIKNIYSPVGNGYEDAGKTMKALYDEYYNFVQDHFITGDIENLKKGDVFAQKKVVDLRAQMKAAECNRQTQAALKEIATALQNGYIDHRTPMLGSTVFTNGNDFPYTDVQKIELSDEDKKTLNEVRDSIYSKSMEAQAQLMQMGREFRPGEGMEIDKALKEIEDNLPWKKMRDDIRSLADKYPDIATEELGNTKGHKQSTSKDIVEAIARYFDPRGKDADPPGAGGRPDGGKDNPGGGKDNLDVKHPLKEGSIGSQTLHSKRVQDMIQMYDQDNSFDASFYTNGKRRRQFIDKRKGLIKEMNKKVKGETPEQERKRKSDMARVIAYFDLGYVRNYLINRERNLMPGFGKSKDKELEWIYRNATGDKTTPPTEISNKVDNLLRFANHFILDVSDGKNRLGSYNTMVIDHIYGQVYSNSTDEAGLLGYMDKRALGKRGKELYKPFSNYARCATNVLKGLSSMVNVLSAAGASIDHAEEAVNTGKWKNMRDLEPPRQARAP